MDIFQIHSQIVADYKSYICSFINITLDQDEHRKITLEPAVYQVDEENKRPIFANVFSRGSGHSFMCVCKSPVTRKLEPREFRSTTEDDEETSDGNINPRIYEPFPFLSKMSPATTAALDSISEHYHKHRRQLMLKLQLGLTKTYNLFHDPELTVELVAKESKQPLAVAESALADPLQLRTLHEQTDQAVLAAYGWDKPSDAGPALALRHACYEVDYLPENDRLRYPIHPDTRKEFLKRLLQLNHKLYAKEEAKGLHKKKPRKKNADSNEGQQEFGIT